MCLPMMMIAKGKNTPKLKPSCVASFHAAVLPIPSDSIGRKRPRHENNSSGSAFTATATTPNRRSVHFAPHHAILATVTSSAEMSPTEKSAVWYPQSDLERFKESARTVGRRVRTEELKHPHRVTQIDDDDDDDCLRGLEHRTSLERQRNKYVAQRAVVECHRRLKRSAGSQHVDPTVHLALVSAKVTRWAREVALSTGRSDFLAAYPMLRGVVPDGPTLEQIGRTHPFPLALKRRSSFGGGQVGRVSPVQRRAATPPLSPAAPSPAVVSPVQADKPPLPVVLSPVCLSAVSVVVEEDEDSDDEARRRIAKRQKRLVHHHALAEL